jgi:hypothetical protein
MAQVVSYCVDTASLPDDEVYVVKGFLKEEGKPKGCAAQKPHPVT